MAKVKLLKKTDNKLNQIYISYSAACLHRFPYSFPVAVLSLKTCMDVPNQECWKRHQGTSCDMTQEKKKENAKKLVQL
jgi:hypothetical protein